MRKIIFSALAAVSIMTLWTSASPVLARDYKYCLQGKHWGYPGNCQFSSYEQCLASASGTNSGCGINPRYAYGRQRYRY